jgi:hypothetical protein
LESWLSQSVAERRALAIVADLMGRSRLLDAAAKLGLELDFVSPSEAGKRLEGDYHLMILDLDESSSVLPLLQQPDAPQRPARVIGYYSHVREDIARDAAGAGVQAYPRGRFWRDLSAILGSAESA